MINKDMDKENDEILFLRLQNGEEKVFDCLFLRYYPSLCAYARQFVEFEDGQEIVQDVMVWLWENREIHIVDTSLKNYLFKAVKTMKYGNGSSTGCRPTGNGWKIPTSIS